jgi:hypothetical protein
MSTLVVALIAGALAVGLWQAPQGVAQEQQPLLEYPEFPPTPTVGPNPTPLARVASAPLFTTDFAAESALGYFTFVDLEPVLPDSASNWALTAEGRLAQQETGRARNPSIQQTAALVGSGWGDVTVTTSFYDQMNGTAGLIARYSGAEPTTASYYRYRVIKNGFEASPKQVLEKVENGVATTLTEVVAPGFEERVWNVVSLTVTGGTLTVSLNGQVVAEAEDPAPLGPGQAGIYTRAIGGILFDDFSVVAP